MSRTTGGTRWSAAAVVPAALAGLALGAAWLVGPAAGGAQAAARVTVANEFGRAEADRAYSTPVTVSGSGFQSIQGGFGGIYVLFGWVDDAAGGSWAPSRGGVTGGDYLYVPDSETKDNQGYQRFVAFPGSETEYAANGGTVAADGTWSLTMTIPGPTFQAVDRTGATQSVDCLTVTCGVITIGAHGVVNANNETFTPVAFADVYGGGAAPAPAPTTGGAGAAGQATPEAERTGQTTTPATVGIDQSTAVVGRALGFTGRGFTPGEQVVGSLGGGLAAIGPLTAGAQGEVAGVLQLPADIRPGTHTFRLTGAGSQRVAEVEFQVIADPVAAAAAANAAEVAAGPAVSPAAVAVGVVGLGLLGLVVASFVAARRRRRAARAVAPAAPSAAPATDRPATDPPHAADARPTQVLPPVPAHEGAER